MGLGEISSDAERSTHVLAMDQDVHQASDRPSSGRRFAAGGGVPKGPENDRRVLLTAVPPIGCHPSVVVEAVARYSPNDCCNSEGAFRAGRHVSENVPDAPLGTQRSHVPLLVIERGESLSQIEDLISFCFPYLHIIPPRCR